MTVQQFSDQFDVLYNNITSNQAAGLNEYEKSVFLTKAQDEIVKNYFSPKGNPKQDGFDDSPKRQADFATLIESVAPGILGSNVTKFDPRSTPFQYPSDVFLTLNEQLSDGNIPIVVTPISFDEYDRLMAKPYKFPPKYQAWRLITKTEAIGGATAVTEYYSFASASDTHIVSSYPKPIRLLIYIQSNRNSEAPKITESSGLVTVALNIGYLDHTTTGAYYTAYGLDTDDSILYNYIGKIHTSGNSSVTVIPSIATGTSQSKEFLHPGGVLGTSLTVAEIIGRFASTPSYRIRYVRRPKAIRLAEFSSLDGPSIGEGTDAQTCELPEHLHEEILQRAVELAKVAWTANGQDNAQMVIQAGQRSE